MSKTYLVASGKGGVGKSTVTACLAVLLARKGRRVVLMDADIGLRSQDLLLGLESFRWRMLAGGLLVTLSVILVSLAPQEETEKS